MSNKYNEPWSNRERTELLVNVLQGQPQDLIAYLINVIHENRIAPQWQETALPEGTFANGRKSALRALLTIAGRSLGACQAEFERLLQNQRPPLQFPAIAQNVPASFPPMQPTRLFAEQSPFQHQQPPRAIQPRPSRSTDSPNPASTNGDSLTIVRTVGPEIGGERRKKRGRPTKEEAEERDRALAAEGKVYEPKKRQTKKFRASTGTPGALPESGFTPSPATHTPLPQTIEAKEETSSSGKRRSKRQGSLTTQGQAEPSSPTTRMSGDKAEKAAESPSDRLLARFGDRAAERAVSGESTQPSK